jgi:hypothetical protein
MHAMIRLPIAPILACLTATAVLANPSLAGPPLAGSAYLGFSKAMDRDAPDGSLGGRINAFAMVDDGWGLGAEVGYLGLGNDGEQCRHIWEFSGCGIVKSSFGKFRGFGIGGLGLYVFDPPVDGGSSQIGFNVGGGFSYHPSYEGRISLGLDVRYHAVVDVGPEQQTLDIISLMAGVNYGY